MNKVDHLLQTGRAESAYNQTTAGGRFKNNTDAKNQSAAAGEDASRQDSFDRGDSFNSVDAMLRQATGSLANGNHTRNDA